jgi:hypothetical protein
MRTHTPPQPAQLDTAFAATFYTWQCVACLLWWLLVFLGTKRPTWSHARGSVFTRPPYLPKALLHALRRHSLVVFVLAPTNLLAETKQLQRALELFTTCHSRSRIALGQDHPTTKKCKECIQRCQMQLAFARLSHSEKHMFS